MGVAKSRKFRASFLRIKPAEVLEIKPDNLELDDATGKCYPEQGDQPHMALPLERSRLRTESLYS
eukprot:5999392-Amphidinium_carterae.1